MASVFMRKGSPYFWIKTRDASGKWTNSSTGIRTDSPGGKRQAAAKAHLESARETDLRAGRTGAALDSWVPGFLKGRYEARQPKSYARYVEAWAALALYLRESGVVTANQMTRHLAKQYPYWRVTPRPGIKAVKWNTALLEVKLLSLIFDQAVERGQIPGNPCARLGLKRERTKEKHPFTAAHQALVEAELLKQDKPEWMRVSWAIAIRQGCRISETSVPMGRIDLASKPPTITFHIKGDRMHIAPLHPELVPLIKRLRREGKTVTCVLPKHPGRVWQNWLWRKLKLTQYSFHSTRVTAVTRLAAANFSQALVKDYVGHASTTVNDVYRKLRPRDLVGLSAALNAGKAGR